jgi:2-polyprenyl-6-methoxyphenol hydroxylase-like FAD-dependent oxidoreductase
LPDLRGGADLRPLGVGINIVPHASKIFAELESDEALARVSVLTGEAVFFNRFGQSSMREPLGRAAGYRTIRSTRFIAASCSRSCSTPSMTGWARQPSRRAGKCVAVDQDRRWRDRTPSRAATGESMARQRASAVVGCDGFHSTYASFCIPTRAAALLRREHVARRRRVAAVSVRSKHDPRGMAQDRQDGHLPDS